MNINDEQLRKLREKWEYENDEVIGEHMSEEKGALYVVLRFKDKYLLHRYFKSGERWEVSIDFRSDKHGMMKKLLEEL